MKISKKALALFLALALLVGVSGGVWAADVAQQISALLDPSIGIKYQGELKTLTDANGSQVYPISYNGTTYVPVRAVATIFGVEVDWDGGTRTVLLGAANGSQGGTQSGGELDLAKAMNAGNEYYYPLNDTSALVVPGDEGNVTFNSGIGLSIWNGSSSTMENRLVLIDVKGKSTLTFTAWTDLEKDTAVVKIFSAKDRNSVITSFDVEAGSLVSKEINIADYDEIAFSADAKGTFSTAKGTVRIFDPIAR